MLNSVECLACCWQETSLRSFTEIRKFIKSFEFYNERSNTTCKIFCVFDWIDFYALQSIVQPERKESGESRTCINKLYSFLVIVIILFRLGYSIMCYENYIFVVKRRNIHMYMCIKSKHYLKSSTSYHITPYRTASHYIASNQIKSNQMR